MTTQSFFQNPGTQITLKLVLIFFLIIFLLIPKFMILNLIEERQKLRESVKTEVASGWAEDQVITGPALVIPYHYLSKDDKGNPVKSSKSNLIIYPEKLDVDGDLETQSKYRSLYKVLLYQSKLSFSGKIVIPEIKELGLQDAVLLYDDAYVASGISDLKGIQNNVQLVWNGQKTKVSPGIQEISYRHQNVSQTSKLSQYSADGTPFYGINTGLSAPVFIEKGTASYDFTFQLNIKGSHTLLFCPIAKNTSVNISSSFADPTFVGSFLPVHNSSKQGFDAQWKVLEYNKSLPPHQKANNIIDMGSNLFGVQISEPVDNYAKTYRAGKYMILFVILTFLVVFLTEIVERLNIHIYQYTLIGLALAIFFTLLLSISEFWGFDFAYSGASSATIGLIFLYSLGMFKKKKSSAILLGLMISLFAYIYIIIQLEKTALLAGSIGLFVIIALTMYVTRKIKWFEESESSNSFFE